MVKVLRSSSDCVNVMALFCSFDNLGLSRICDRLLMNGIPELISDKEYSSNYFS